MATTTTEAQELYDLVQEGLKQRRSLVTAKKLNVLTTTFTPNFFESFTVLFNHAAESDEFKSAIEAFV